MADALVAVSIEDARAKSLLGRVLALISPAQTDELMERIANAIERNAHLRFDLEQDPDGKRWAEWAPATRAHHEKEGRGSRILEETGHMRDSIQRTHSPTLALVAVLAPCAIYHDSTEPRESALPRRGILHAADGGLGRDDMDAVQQLLDDYANSL